MAFSENIPDPILEAGNVSDGTSNIEVSPQAMGAQFKNKNSSSYRCLRKLNIPHLVHDVGEVELVKYSRGAPSIPLSRRYGISNVDPMAFSFDQLTSHTQAFQPHRSKLFDTISPHFEEPGQIIRLSETVHANNNWTKLGLGILFLKDGLREFIMTEMESFQDDILHQISSRHSSPVVRCSQCTTANVLSCPTRGICSGTPCRYHDINDPLKTTRECLNNVCQVFREHIFHFHRHNPNWANTDARKWSSTNFEISKCYFQTTWNRHDHTMEEVNVIDLLSVIINHTRVSERLSENRQIASSSVNRARDIGHNFLLSVQREITDGELNDALVLFIAILSDPKFLASYQPAMLAVAHLQRLKTPDVVIQADDEARVFQEYMRFCSKALWQDNSDTHYLITSMAILKDRAVSVKAKHTVEWNNVFLQQMQTTHKIEMMLGDEVYPNQIDLNKACTLFGRKSSVFVKLCEEICAKIKTSSADIKRVWSGYKPVCGRSEESIVFVAVTENRRRTDTVVLGFDVVFCNECDWNDEGKCVMNSPQRKAKLFKNAELKQLQHCLQKHSPDLMSSHSNLEIVSACSVKSMQFINRDGRMTISNETCVVLYVHVKGVIPLQEGEFPKQIGGFPVDIREGGFNLYVGGPMDKHDPLKMGCAISSKHLDSKGNSKCGTLGAFIERDGKQFCITSAHVLLNRYAMADVKLNGGKREYPSWDIPVFQPAAPDRIGYLHEAIYDTGDLHNAGMEIALVEIECRDPREGSFPNADFTSAGFDATQPMVFNSGEIMRKEEFVNSQGRMSSEVVKYGCESLATRGTFSLMGTSVQQTPYRLIHEEDEVMPLCLCGQIEVENIGNISFASPGDSGALVFCFHNSNKANLRPVGVVEGGTTYGTTVITPISDILTKLGVSRLKSFPMDVRGNESTLASDRRNVMPGRTDADFSDKLATVERKLDDKVTKLERKMDDNFETMKTESKDQGKNLEDKIDKIDSNMSEVKGMFGELMNKIGTPQQLESPLTGTRGDEH